MNRAPLLLRVLSIQHRAPRGLSIQRRAPRGLSIQHRAPPLRCGLSIQRPTVPFSRLHSVLHLFFFPVFFFFRLTCATPMTPMTSCTERHAELSTTLKKTVYFLVHNQSADGSWGRWDQPGGTEDARSDNLSGLQFSPSGDAQRSPRALSLLQWYYMHVSADKEVGTAIQKYATFLANKANQAQYGIGAPTWLALPAGFVGLAVADLLQPWSTFRPM